jgi:hypothetical protein
VKRFVVPPSSRKVVAGVSGAVFFVAVNVWALSAIGLFDGHQSSPQAVQVVDDSPSPSATVTPSVARTSTPPSTPSLVAKTTALPTVTSTTPRATRKPSPSEPTPTIPTGPTRTRPTTTKPVPPKPRQAQPRTPEEAYAAYCRQQGWDPDWCDPSNWRTPAAGNHR